MLIVWRMKQDIEYNMAFVISQGLIDGEDSKATIEAWDKYTDSYYPYLAGERGRRDKAAMGALLKEVGKGFLGVKPLQSLIKSRIHKQRKRADGNRDGTLS